MIAIRTTKSSWRIHWPSPRWTAVFESGFTTPALIHLLYVGVTTNWKFCVSLDAIFLFDGSSSCNAYQVLWVLSSTSQSKFQGFLMLRRAANLTLKTQHIQLLWKMQVLASCLQCRIYTMITIIIYVDSQLWIKNCSTCGPVQRNIELKLQESLMVSSTASVSH